MLLLRDIRESRAYQEEAMEEGVKKGREEGVKEGLAIAIVRMAAKNMPAAEIAAILKVDLDLVHRVLAAVDRG